MPRTRIEVLVGTGTLYTAPEGEAFPTNPVTAIAGNWVEIGYSEDGWSFARDVTVEDVFVAEEIDPLFVFKTAQNLRMVGSLAQASLGNLELAFGGGAVTVADPAAGFDTYTPPLTGDYDRIALLLRTTAPEDPAATTRVRDILIPSAVSAGSFEMAHAKAPAKTLLAVEFRILLPTSGPIFEVVDETA